MSIAPRPGPPGVVHPGLARMLAETVWTLRCRTRRRLFAVSARVHLLDSDGAPLGDPSADLLGTSETSPDHALRVDLAVRGLDAVVAEQVTHVAEQAAAVVDVARRPGWSPTSPDGRLERAAITIVRPGPMEPLDTDYGWRRAWLVACGIVDVEPGPTFAVTRAGWLDVDGSASAVVPRRRESSRRRRSS